MKEKIIKILEWLLLKLLKEEAHSHRKYIKTSDINIRIDNLNKTMREMKYKNNCYYTLIKCRRESLQIRKHQIILNIELGKLELQTKGRD